MKQILVIILAGFISCTGQQTKDRQKNEGLKDNEETVATVPPDKGKKWKADDATRKNVAAMLQVASDTIYADPGKRMQLYTDLQAKTDLLVRECSMKGEEHDALHAWLERVLDDLKDLKEEDDGYNETLTELKQNIAGFYKSFE